MIQYKCVKCGAAIESPSSMAGHEEKCPECGQLCTVPGEADSPSTSPQQPKTHHAELATKSPPQGADEEVGSEPEDSGKPKGVENAQREVAHGGGKISGVESAYKPSGKAPTAALICMLAALPLAAVVGITAGAAFGGLTFAIIGLLPWLLWARLGCAGCATVFLVIGSVASIVAGGFWIGLAGGWFVAVAGMLGRNRSPRLAAVVSGVGLSLFPIAVWAFIMMIGSPNAEVDAVLKGGWGVAGLAILVLATGTVAFISSREKASGQKFCEQCSKYMRKIKLPRVSYKGIRKAAAALEAGNIRDAAVALSSLRGDKGLPVVYTCPICGVGFLEIIVGSEHLSETSSGKTSIFERGMGMSIRLDANAVRDLLADRLGVSPQNTK